MIKKRRKFRRNFLESQEIRALVTPKNLCAVDRQILGPKNTETCQKVKKPQKMKITLDQHRYLCLCGSGIIYSKNQTTSSE